jgi:hypothetical protein
MKFWHFVRRFAVGRTPAQIMALWDLQRSLEARNARP